jgi:tetratricopeptide (TPR) repeat protein
MPQEGVKASYDAALRRWPDDALVLFAAAGYALAEHDSAGATTLYRRVLAADPRHAAARNNLANALEAQGCHADALAEARLALATVTPGAPLYGPILETVEQIESAPNDAARACP